MVPPVADHFTEVFDAPVTVAEKGCASPATTEAVGGLIATATVVEEELLPEELPELAGPPPQAVQNIARNAQSKASGILAAEPAGARRATDSSWVKEAS